MHQKLFKRENKFKQIQRETPYFCFLLPALVLYLIFSIYPMLSAVYYSMTNWNGIAVDVKFVGLKNFRYLFQDEKFGIALKNTFTFVIMDVVLQNFFGLITALLILKCGKRVGSVTRTLFFVPAILPGVVVAYMWTYIYGYNGGVINEILQALGKNRIDFLGDGKVGLYYVILAGIWQWMSYRMIIYTAGLQNIPSEIYEAAALDGASGFTRFRTITLPLLTPVFKTNTIMCTIGALKQFDLVYSMTSGGPAGATEVIGTKIYREAFVNLDYGYGCAIGMVLFVFIMFVTIGINKVFEKREVEM